MTEANDYLRLLFSKIGRLFCRGCGREVLRDNPQTRGRDVGVAARPAAGS